MKKIQKNRLIPFLILIIVLALALILINGRDEAVVGKVYYDNSGWQCEGDKCICIFQGCAYNGEKVIIGTKIDNSGKDPGISSSLNADEEKCGFLCKFVNLLVGDKEARAGRSWFDRGNIVGSAINGWDLDSTDNGNHYICVSPTGCYDEKGKLHEYLDGYTYSEFNPNTVSPPPTSNQGFDYSYRTPLTCESSDNGFSCSCNSGEGCYYYNRDGTIETMESGGKYDTNYDPRIIPSEPSEVVVTSEEPAETGETEPTEIASDTTTQPEPEPEVAEEPQDLNRIAPQLGSEVAEELNELGLHSLAKNDDGTISGSFGGDLLNTIEISAPDGNGIITTEINFNSDDIPDKNIYVVDQQRIVESEAGRVTIFTADLTGNEGPRTFYTEGEFNPSNFEYYETEEDRDYDKPQGRLEITSTRIIDSYYGWDIPGLDMSTQVIEYRENNRVTYLEGTYDEDEDKFKPSGGTIFERQEDGTLTRQRLLDYDYDGDGLEQVQLFDPVSGRQVGTAYNFDNDFEPDITYRQDGMVITVYNTAGEEIGSFVRQEDGSWINQGNIVGLTHLDPDLYQHLDETYQPSFTASEGIQSIYAVSSQIRSYPALANLLDVDNWLFEADRTFAPLLGEQWFPSLICETLARSDMEPEDGFASIRSPFGIDQPVAGIQMERTPGKSPALCHQNPDEESDQLYICKRGQVCVEDLCYLDSDNNRRADSDQPVEEYFYKITWGASAPRDEASTPFIDENGVAVSFNIWIDQEANDQVDSNAIAMYSFEGDTTGPIRLENGARDQGIIVHYSSQDYQEACIGWNQAPEDVNDVCFTLVESSQGEVNWESANRPSSSNEGEGSRRVSSGQVGLNSNW